MPLSLAVKNERFSVAAYILLKIFQKSCKENTFAKALQEVKAWLNSNRKIDKQLLLEACITQLDMTYSKAANASNAKKIENLTKLYNSLATTKQNLELIEKLQEFGDRATAVTLCQRLIKDQTISKNDRNKVRFIIANMLFLDVSETDEESEAVDDESMSKEEKLLKVAIKAFEYVINNDDPGADTLKSRVINIFQGAYTEIQRAADSNAIWTFEARKRFLEYYSDTINSNSNSPLAREYHHQTRLTLNKEEKLKEKVERLKLQLKAAQSQLQGTSEIQSEDNQAKDSKNSSSKACQAVLFPPAKGPVSQPSPSVEKPKRKGSPSNPAA